MRFLRQNLPSFVCGVLFAVIGLLFLLFGPIVFPGTAKVIDGDSLKLTGYNVRLAGLDAAELPVVDGKKCRKHNPLRSCQNAASKALADLVEGKTVFCLMVAFDWRNRRPVAVCKVNDIEINEWLIKNCLAGSPRNEAHRIAYYEEMIRKRRCNGTS